MSSKTGKTLAGIALALSTIVPTALAAEPAAAHPQRFHVYTTTDTNRGAFKKHRADYFAVHVKAHQRSGKGIRGKAALYLDGDLQRIRYLRSGNILFRVDRSDLRNNRSVTVTVRIFPHDDRKQHKIVRRHVTDRPERRSSPGKRVVRVAKAQVGDRYVWGADGPGAFDCSGLTAYAWRHGAGKRLPHSSAAQKDSGHRVSRSQARPGDLVYTPGHIALYAGDGKVVEAATPSSGVVLRKMWQKGPVFIRP